MFKFLCQNLKFYFLDTWTSAYLDDTRTSFKQSFMNPLTHLGNGKSLYWALGEPDSFHSNGKECTVVRQDKTVHDVPCKTFTAYVVCHIPPDLE